MQVVLEYAGQSFRLLALAAGTLRRVTAERPASMSQQEAEAECGHMDLLALLVLSNSAHSSSRPATTSLQERYTRAAFTCAIAARNLVSCLVSLQGMPTQLC